MKLSSLVGLTVISLESGKAIGEIKKLLIDADPKKVEFIVLDLFEDKRDGFAIHLFRFGDLQGIGDVAVTIESLDQVRTISSEALYKQVFADQISIHASRVISHVGNDLGTLKDFIFDSESAVIKAVVLEEGGQLYYYKADPYLLLSEKCLVLNPDQLITAEEYASYDSGGSSSLTENMGAQFESKEEASYEMPAGPVQTASQFRPATDFNRSAQGPMPTFQPTRKFVQNIPMQGQVPQGQDPQAYPGGNRPISFNAPPQRTFQQHIPGMSDNYQQGAASSQNLNNYDLAEPKVPEMPSTQKRAGGLFFRRGEKKSKQEAPAPKQPGMNRMEETMNDQDMLDAMKGFMKS